MIGRKTTAKIAEYYRFRFGTYHRLGNGVTRYEFFPNKFHDFLFVRDYEPWFLIMAKLIPPYDDTLVNDFFMGLHTGMTLLSQTQNWSQQQRLELGQGLLAKLGGDILAWYDPLPPHDSDCYSYDDLNKELVALLELDGYVFRNGRLLFSEANVLSTQEEQGILHSLMVRLGLDNQRVMVHHLELSEAHYLDQRWDDSIANSRKFLESVLQAVAAKHSLEAAGQELPDDKYGKPIEVRKYLENAGLVDHPEVMALAAVYGLLSNAGGHPYIAEKDQARLLRNMALTFAQFVLLRLQGALSNR